jgi:hypothetical protein
MTGIGFCVLVVSLCAALQLDFPRRRWLILTTVLDLCFRMSVEISGLEPHAVANFNEGEVVTKISPK